MRVLVPAFVTSELKTAFQIGFLVFVPFLMIDLIVASLLKADMFLPQVPIGQNPDAGAAGRGIGTLFVAWLVLAYVLKQRWVGKVLEDERDTRIELVASQWGRAATA